MLQKELLNKTFPQITDSNKEDFLSDLTERYPYFLPAAYFLLRQKGNFEKMPFLAAKVALGFNSSFLLQQRLLDDDIIEKEELSSIDSIQNQIPVKNDLSIPSDDMDKDKNQTTEQKVNPEDKERTIPQPMKEDPLGELTFEPLYATDYFASQGIKITDEMLNNDKLGKQLKSFTAWLKTMKRIPTAQNEVAIDKSIEVIAEKSNKEEEIITTSMAEVYENQGKFEKAREIYKKLSLQNPSKSAYFAAKLEKIKDY